LAVNKGGNAKKRPQQPGEIAPNFARKGVARGKKKKVRKGDETEKGGSAKNPVRIDDQ